MEVADRLCKKAGNPPGLFQALMPSPILQDLDRLYEPHVVELCERYKAGSDLGLATKAEVLAGLMQTSLKSPLTSSGLALTEKLFRECMGELAGADMGREAYPGQLDELLAEAQHKLRCVRNGPLGSEKRPPPVDPSWKEQIEP